MDDLISRKEAYNLIMGQPPEAHYPSWYAEQIMQMRPAQKIEDLDPLVKALEAEHKKLREMQKAQPEIIRCKDCKHNPKYEWFGCPMSHLSEKQRPETAWCWKAERRC